MEERTNGQRFGMAMGTALVMWGVWLLFARLFGGLVEPLRAVMHLASGLAWPLVLVALGALIIARGRDAQRSHPAATRRLLRSRSNRVVTGLLGGVAAYLGLSAGLVRAVYALLTIAMGGPWGVVFYALGSLLVPEMPASAVVDVPSAPAAPAAPPVTSPAQ